MLLTFEQNPQLTSITVMSSSDSQQFRAAVSLLSAMASFLFAKNRNNNKVGSKGNSSLQLLSTNYNTAPLLYCPTELHANELVTTCVDDTTHTGGVGEVRLTFD